MTRLQTQLQSSVAGLSGESLKPIGGAERVQELDVVRGFALFGVLLVNAIGFNYHHYPSYRDGLLSASLEQGAVNGFLSVIINTFAVANFYTIFSFLFGLGFYIFYRRAEEKGREAKKLFVRRCMILLAFGGLHFALVWQGDILHTYALVGLLLPKFVSMDLRGIRRWIVALLVISTFLISGLFYLQASAGIADEALGVGQSSWVERLVGVYSHGSYLETVSFRLRNQTAMTLGNSLLALPKVLGLFLMGLYTGKSGIVYRLRDSLPRIRRVWQVAGVAGFFLALGYAVTQFGPDFTSPARQLGLSMLFKEASSVFISLFYTTSIVLLYQKAASMRLLIWLAPLGQMALTNYLMQCIICSVLFYGYGPRLAPSIAGILMVSMFIYGGQILFSSIWLKRYRYGPFESVWRYLTYSGTI